MSLVVIDIKGIRLTPDERSLLADEPIAGVCLFGRNTPDRERTRDLVDEIRAAAGRPQLVTIDQEGGAVARLVDGPVPPSAMALGAVDDLALTEAVAAATARSLRAAGVDLDFAPVADVALDPRNPVIAERAFGADPAFVGRHVAAFVRGLQGAGVAATIKHFPGHGDVAVDSHLDLPYLHVERDRLEAVEWAPFRAGIEAGAAAVMTAHLLVRALDPEWPSTMSATTLATLRRDLGFTGVIFSDALNMRAIADRWAAPEAAVLAVAAGVDAPLLIGPVAEHVAVVRALEAAQREGRLDPAAVAASAERLARLTRTYAASPTPYDDAADRALMASTARRALVAVGSPPRLRPGRPLVVVGTDAVAPGAATDGTVRATAALVSALERSGFEVRHLALGDVDERSATGTPAASAGPRQEALDAALQDAQALVFVSGGRLPLTPAAVAAAHDVFERAEAAGVPPVHVALWNPAHVLALPGPALVAFGFRPDAVAAVVEALQSGAAPGRASMPLAAAGRRSASA